MRFLEGGGASSAVPSGALACVIHAALAYVLAPNAACLQQSPLATLAAVGHHRQGAVYPGQETTAGAMGRFRT